MSSDSSTQWNTIAVVGAGTIGLAWAALFSAAGRTVRVTDPRADLEDAMRDAMPMLAASTPGATGVDDLLERIEITRDLADAVRDADLVQENGPERLEGKRALLARIVRAAPEHAVLASSSSGIVASDIAAQLPDDAAARLLIAHPFNPPQVVPLVEIVPGSRTSEDVVQAATDFYRSLGKSPVRLRKEVDGFVANRLQRAVMREAIDLVLRGVVRSDELDTVMKESLGGRYATVGPFESFHLGGGPGGIRHMMAHLGTGMAESWNDLGNPELNERNTAMLVDQIEDAYGSDSRAYRARAESRDRRQRAVHDAVSRTS